MTGRTTVVAVCAVGRPAPDGAAGLRGRAVPPSLREAARETAVAAAFAHGMAPGARGRRRARRSPRRAAPANTGPADARLTGAPAVRRAVPAGRRRIGTRRLRRGISVAASSRSVEERRWGTALAAVSRNTATLQGAGPPARAEPGRTLSAGCPRGTPPIRGGDRSAVRRAESETRGGRVDRYPRGRRRGAGHQRRRHRVQRCPAPPGSSALRTRPDTAQRRSDRRRRLLDRRLLRCRAATRPRSPGRVRAIRLAENSGGCGEPRNQGLAVARGRYVMFLDSDDTLEPNACRNMLEAADRTGADLVSGLCVRVHTDSRHDKRVPGTRGCTGPHGPSSPSPSCRTCSSSTPCRPTSATGVSSSSRTSSPSARHPLRGPAVLGTGLSGRRTDHADPQHRLLLARGGEVHHQVDQQPAP